MASPKILDSHIHLWPSTATSPTDHSWMTPGFPLAKQHGITEYDAATASAPIPSAFIYVETDRHLPSSTPSLSPSDSPSAKAEKIKTWARAPLEELAFLGRLVTGALRDGDGANPGDAPRLKGLVIWAPFHLPSELFSIYLRLAGETLGEEALARVVGFRYLLQGRSADEVKAIIGNEWFAGNVRSACGLGKKSLAFDVGVDAHRDGIETVEAVAGLVEGVEEGVNFVLNHLCKPDLSTPNWPSFERWANALGRLSSHPNLYIKLSGALNEFSPAATPASADEILKALKPYLDHVLQNFGAHRILFGSDWPVCNVGGPKGESGNWALWAEVVEKWLEERGLSAGEREWIWGKTAAAAYGIGEF
ncbi:L-rhamnono-gamma-lactonase [Kalmusia sp. IMI 367209]|nr:L-rhamnono-gamma-lactonase [Kalmusia sp. IMI 367209]